MEKKKKPNIFLIVLFILFVIYISLDIASSNGYYDNLMREKAILTEENIKEFEDDVKNNRDIDIKKYTEKETKDYRGFASNMGETFSNFVEKLMTEELGKMGKTLKKLFTN